MYKNKPQPLQPGSRPTTLGTANPNCPIITEAKEVLDKTKDLHRAIRKLRISSQRCRTCPEHGECPTLQNISQAVDIAILELRQEWGMDHE